MPHALWLCLAAHNRADMLMSTLLNLVQAMGGDIEVRAAFPDRAIEISTFSSLSGKPAKSRTGKSSPLMLYPPDCGGGSALRERNNRSGRPGRGWNPIDA